jgi:hypothetical protein
MAYTGYGRLGDIGKFGILGGYGTPEGKDSIFDFGKTNFAGTKIKTKRCADGSLPPCDEDVVTTSDDGCVYGRNADGSCKEPNVPKCSDKGAGWYGNWGTAGEGCWQVPTGVNVTETDQGNVFTHGTKYGMTDARDIYGRTGADAFEKGAYLPNYSALYSGGASTGGQGPNLGVWTEGPYALEGPEKSLLGYNLLGQPTDPEFVRRMNEINDGTWSAEDEDRFVLERTLGGIDKSILEEGEAITDAYGDNPYKGLLAKEGEDFLKGAAGSGTTGYYTTMSEQWEEHYNKLKEEKERLDAMKSSAMVDSFSILDVRKEYEQAEHELDRMADAGILSTAEVTDARRNLHQEEDDAVEEVVAASTGGDGGGGDDEEEKKPDKPKKTKKKTRRPPQKAAKTKAKTKKVTPYVAPYVPPTIYTTPYRGDPVGRKPKPKSKRPGGAPRKGPHG